MISIELETESIAAKRARIVVQTAQVIEVIKEARIIQFDEIKNIMNMDNAQLKYVLKKLRKKGKLISKKSNLMDMRKTAYSIKEERI